MTTNDSVPIGTIIMWPGVDDAPSDWLLCDGSAHDNGRFPALAKLLAGNFGNGPAAEDASNRKQFHVPDLRGQFVRGVDSTRPDQIRDPDRDTRTNLRGEVIGAVVGSMEADQFRSHTHEYNAFPMSEGNIAAGRYWQAGATQTGAAGGSETRPRNTYLYFLIKAL